MHCTGFSQGLFQEFFSTIYRVYEEMPTSFVLGTIVTK